MTKNVQRSILFLIVFCCFLAVKPLSRSLPPEATLSVELTSVASSGDISMAVPVMLDSETETMTDSEHNSTSVVKETSTVKVDSPQKWETFQDLEHVSSAKQLTIYTPINLPIGFVLQKVEHLQGVTRATYVYGEQEIQFVQKSIKSKREVAEVWSSDEQTDGLLSVSWTTNRSKFLLSGDNVSREKLSSFQQSLHKLTDGKEQANILPFHVIELTGFSDKNGVKKRRFKLFTPEQFQDFITNQRLVEKEAFQPLDNSIVLGLFSGMKGSSGYSIEVLDITLREHQLNVSFTESEPAREDSVLAYLTYPSQFVNVALPTDEITSVQFLTDKGEAVAHLPLSVE